VALGGGDTCVVGATVGATVLDRDGGTVDRSVGPDGEVADGDAIGWHPRTADPAKHITRSIRFTRSLSNDIVPAASDLERS
jgi:hypothetical protein